jgi:hypothetical protein
MGNVKPDWAGVAGVSMPIRCGCLSAVPTLLVLVLLVMAAEQHNGRILVARESATAPGSSSDLLNNSGTGEQDDSSGGGGRCGALAMHLSGQYTAWQLLRWQLCNALPVVHQKISWPVRCSGACPSIVFV